MFVFIATPIVVSIIYFLVIAFFCQKEKELWATSLITLALCAIFSGLFYYFGTMHSRYKEIWNYKIISMSHEEKWSERERRERQEPDGTERVAVGTDEDGDTKYETRTKYKTVVYYVTEYYGPYWKSTDEYGVTRSVDEESYLKWKAIWKNEKKTGEHKGSSAGFDTSITGGIYEINWNGEFDTIYPFEEIKVYENRVRATKNTFNFAEPSPESLKKYPRPADVGNISPILSYGTKILPEDQMYFRRLNALLGNRNQIRIMLLTFDASVYARNVVDEVLSSWQGVNKNELAVFIGLDGEKIQWISVNSWMDNTTLHALIETNFHGKEFRTTELGEFIKDNVAKHWKRKQFSDFSYLTINIHWGFKFGLVVLSLVTAGTVFGLTMYNKEDFKRSNKYDQY